VKRYFILFFIFLGASKSYCQLNLTKDSVEKILTKSPAFSIFKDNYFIVGTTLQEEPTKYNSDVIPTKASPPLAERDHIYF